MFQSESQIIQSIEIPEGGCDLRAVLALCRDTMESLSGGAAPKDWLTYSFEYLRACFFPENFKIEDASLYEESLQFYFRVLNGLFERERRELPLDPLRDFQLITDEEESHCYIRSEYARFRECFSQGNIYAFMRLSRVCTPFDTLGHIAGVHHVAMYMTRQLLAAGVKVDPGLMSGAAILHDIGKFGCRPTEARRVPYLHYYYTYQFCEKYQLPNISSIGSNHSVWDLELDNLSVESLLLIYADFRVKSVYDEAKREQIRFWSLDESYDVILNKLDNVDEAKKRRYAKVYSKLKDFENYLISLGCRTDLVSPYKAPAKSLPTALMGEQRLLEECKYQSIQSNLSVMYHIGHAERFLSIMEEVGSEKDWRHVRAFLTVVGEFSGYLSQKQKDMILRFLYDMMTHRDGDIRRQAASIAGKIIAHYELRYTKEVPEGYVVPHIGQSSDKVWESYLQRMILPNHALSARHRRWIGYAMKNVLAEMQRSAENKQSVLEIYTSLCEKEELDELSVFMLLDGAADISVDDCSPVQRERLESLAKTALRVGNMETRMGALRFIYTWMCQGWMPKENIHELLLIVYPRIDNEIYCIRYLAARIREYYGIPSERGLVIYDFAPLYLENQRSEVPWICKYVNLEILKKRHSMSKDTQSRYQYASHLLHLLQFTDRIVNRLKAGEDLIELLPVLMPTERYEIVLELMHSLEMSEYAAAKYIPEFLGRAYVTLPLKERMVFLEQFRAMLGSDNQRLISMVVETVGVILQYYPHEGYLHEAELNKDDSGAKTTQREELEIAEGILCTGMAHYDYEVAKETLYITGLSLFGNASLTLEMKKIYFSHLARKMMTLCHQDEEGLFLYYYAAAMHHVYSFISDYSLAFGASALEEEKREAAFFPGTFDPFSLGHKAIVQELHRMGYRVYLAVDEFSWSKKTQPFMIREKILKMATADIGNVYVFPSEIPINIANVRDLSRLSRLMNEEKPYIVVGSDVPKHASAYRVKDKGNVCEYPHIIFARESEQIDRAFMESTIHADLRYVKLPPYYEDISSTRIRESILASKDITNMVDPIVQNYIVSTGIYSMEPTYKKAARVTAIDTETPDRITDELKAEMADYITCKSEEKEVEQVLILREAERSHQVCAAIAYQEIDRSELFSLCENLELAELIRKKTSGKLALILEAGGKVDELDDKRITVVNELLVYLQEQGYSYVLCFDAKQSGIDEALLLHGAQLLCEDSSCQIIDLRNPMVVFYNTPEMFKEPLTGNMELKKAIRRAHLKLLEAVNTFYPGNLVLTFDSNIINYRLIRMITEENRVPITSCEPRRLGEKICVPFGKILRGVLVPNTVTKGLDLEKMYTRDLSSFRITHFPGYAPLDIQLRTIRSFDRPIILVDDLYHMSYRMNEIDKYLEKEHLKEDLLLVGVISGHGRDLAEYKQKHVRAAYTVPNMRHWLIESDLFPFLGGDSVCSDKNSRERTMILPSITQILPYCVPELPEGVDFEAKYRFSKVCLENARDIYKTLESIYAGEYERKLTVERLGEVIAEPRIPDTYQGDRQVMPSRLIEREIERLRRLRNA